MLEEQTDKRRFLTNSEPHAINQIREAFFQLFIHERFFLDFEWRQIKHVNDGRREVVADKIRREVRLPKDFFEKFLYRGNVRLAFQNTKFALFSERWIYSFQTEVDGDSRLHLCHWTGTNDKW